ncbi:MAG: tRNA (N(6)-L-threonylcarbamoyladenosine(37)-C(2))-methylthiotransferase MtaB [Thermoanaerobaculales bacterium]|nr:tRNA (N(6)-L-threonylcarbamoyladenosine(37)-C(2))-methylthiotransferase MtaB [Thermoanaerobaculales bacterium]
MRIRLDSVGCRLNIGEVESMARALAAAGHEIVPGGVPADLCVLNTCAVTAEAARTSRHLIRQLRRHNPGAAVVATGCLAELEPESLSALGIDLVIGNDAKDRLPELVLSSGLLDLPPPPRRSARPPAASATGRRTRAFLKIQDGCDNACTFCVVTIARGRGRSTEPDRVVEEVRGLRGLGVREVVLSGVHLGSYGHDIGDRRGLGGLVRRILAETDLPRLRLSSLEPWDLEPDFFEVFENPRVMPDLHLPLQSGCDATLRRMARRTGVDEYSRLVEAARLAIPDLSVSTDVMVGFPGETEQEFNQSEAAVEAIGFSRLHVFRYSPRPGTPASALPGRVHGTVSRERSRRLHALGDRLARGFQRRFLGRRLEVLWEDDEAIGDRRRWSGLTGNAIRVLTETDATGDLANRITGVVLESCVPGGVIGSVADPLDRPAEDHRPVGRAGS